MQDTILVVEDDTAISGLLVRILKDAGYKSRQAFSGTEAELLLERGMPKLILLDLMLPGLSGEELLRHVREEKGMEVPILVLSAKNSLRDKVELLKLGADDYITKPFEPEEVIARIQAALRRAGREMAEAADAGTLAFKNMKLYPRERRVTVGERELVLTVHEYEILYLLIKNPQKVYSRESLYEQVWQGGYYGENNTVNVHVSNLRKKLKEADPLEEYIRTVYGIGFKLG